MQMLKNSRHFGQTRVAIIDIDSSQDVVSFNPKIFFIVTGKPAILLNQKKGEECEIYQLRVRDKIIESSVSGLSRVAAQRVLNASSSEKGYPEAIRVAKIVMTSQQAINNS